tara:strand:+ start:2945 stop:3433 length:489 start_codon:yes stop_codon:yes gene_type:complete
MKNVEVEVGGQFSEVLDIIFQFKNTITMLQNQVKCLEKNTNKTIRKLERELNKKKMKRSREPSGFAKPTKISNELCDFLNKPYGSEVARTEVTKYIISYINENKLQCEQNKKLIEPDKKLERLLSPGENADITYFTLQGYMNKHFINNKKNNITNNETLLSK